MNALISLSHSLHHVAPNILFVRLIDLMSSIAGVTTILLLSAIIWANRVVLLHVSRFPLVSLLNADGASVATNSSKLAKTSASHNSGIVMP